MHPSSFEIIRLFARHYVQKEARILEVGSWNAKNQQNVKVLFPHCTEYVGMDISEGPGVDVVAALPYLWHEQFEQRFDVVLSVQVFEHNPFFWLTTLNMSLVLQRGGVMLIVAPSAGNVHRYPLDCWRFYPDAGLALAKYSFCELVESNVLGAEFPRSGAALWKDWFVVLRKETSNSEAEETMRRILLSHNHLTNVQRLSLTGNTPLIDSLREIESRGKA